MTRVAVFRPAGERLRSAVDLLESLGVDPVADAMIAVEPTGARPRDDADYVVLTSTTGVALLDGWDPGDATVCAIGEHTAAALREAGYEVELVPETHSSAGIVDLLDGRVTGERVEVARSDHGSDVLPDGLDNAGAYHHETVLYRLVRPDESGESAVLAAEGELAGALFTSPLTAEHFLDAADERGRRDAAIRGLEDAVVGAIGEPTRETAEHEGIDVDVVPETASFEALARAVVDRLPDGHVRE